MMWREAERWDMETVSHELGPPAEGQQGSSCEAGCYDSSSSTTGSIQLPPA